MNLTLDDLKEDITKQVTSALLEDLGEGDITARLIPETRVDTAEIITRENCVLCGQAWLEETFKQLDGLHEITWHTQDGDEISKNEKIVTLNGKSQTLLTGERVALNFLQLLSGVATKSREYSKLVKGSQVKLLDTRKTIPGLRTAQKYAVTVGGCHNHRIGLFDAFLIKENHITACGSITAAIEKARKTEPEKPIEIEVETLEELAEALFAKANIVMLDNFSHTMLEEASKLDKLETKFELSGNLCQEDIPKFLHYNIDYMSFGALTKHVRAVDLSMLII